MTAKEYLGQAWKLEREITVRLSELEAMRSALHGRGINYERIGGQAADNALEKAICRVVVREDEINKEIAQLVAKKAEIASTISMLSDVRLRELLVRRYLCFEQWSKISNEMRLDLRWVYRLHERALREIGKRLQN